jgi:hypothetical protein
LGIRIFGIGICFHLCASRFGGQVGFRHSGFGFRAPSPVGGHIAPAFPHRSLSTFQVVSAMPPIPDQFQACPSDPLVCKLPRTSNGCGSSTLGVGRWTFEVREPMAPRRVHSWKRKLL